MSKRIKSITNIPLQKARQDWLLGYVASLQLDTPGKEITEKTEYNDSTVSLYLSGARYPSTDFLQKFCKVYNIDYTKLNLDLVDKVKNQIVDNNGGVTTPKSNPTSEKNKPEVNKSDSGSEPDENDGDGVHSYGTKILVEMEYLEFMKNTIEWQRNVVEDQKIIMKMMVSKIPDAERSSFQSPKDKTG